MNSNSNKKMLSDTLYHEPFELETGGLRKRKVLCWQKELSTYNINVYAFLKKRRNIHIPRIFDYREKDGHLTVIEEFIKGVTLDVFIRDNAPDRKARIAIIKGICDGLIFLHSAKPPIIHRDLKPQNIMISDDRVIIIDYDAARIYQAGNDRDTEYLGTRGYAAPEQYGFAQTDERTDIFALGKLMEWMFPDDKPMSEIVKVATQIDPKNRFVNVQEMKHLLKYAEKADPESVRVSDELYTEEYRYCTNCGAVLDDQPGFENNDGTWICTECGQRLYGDEAGDTGNYVNGVIWYCDNCGAIMNKQQGFDYYADRWTCTECGYDNDISEANIVNPAMHYK